ncbi:MAG TPA: c-type cytochrome biogenesis protein CcsB [Actinomycetota bacterium]|nr:c-type cytochrome biogenesis protein CcsB [Actinomycetota bacterium]
MTTEQWTRISTDAFNVALFAYVSAMVGYFHHLAFRRTPVWRVARLVAVAGVVAHGLSIAARALAADRVPWGNMYEYSSLLAFLVVAVYLVYVEGVRGLRALGGFALAVAALTMAVAVSFLYVGPGPLVPALNSYWIKVHVVAAIAGSSLLSLGAVCSGLYLFQERRERRLAAVGAPAGKGRPAPIMGGSGVRTGPVGSREGETGSIAVARGGLLPTADGLDRLASRIIAFAFPIWTFAVIAGAIWAQEAWGRYWGWDPKETWSFITWVLFAGYLHARATSGWQGRRAAVLALVGFASLVVNFYAVNLWIVGLHSYAGVS